ncbi:hypothetical protein [Halorubrum distributum]|uniref:Uncharacterized protein n=1 Tax=Halorubrum distributum TaxID=29283 RepID=A0A6B1IJQ5_9EURY|nr:hypothetical protein [Halorubrum terrestre]MYL66627.1 hypothetical protein [Halorubrum terrestre]
MKIGDALSQLEERFVTSPANYVVEAEIVFELKHILNEQLQPAELNGQHDSGKSRGSIPDHSEYADAIVSTEEFDRVHCEVSGATFNFASEQRRLDLVIFDEEVTLSLEGGSKKFRVEDVLTAVEFKFIKNAKYLREDSKRYRLISGDIDRLDSLPEHVDTYCLIFSNFGLAQREDTRVALETLKSRSPRVEVRHTHPLSGSVE